MRRIAYAIICPHCRHEFVPENSVLSDREIEVGILASEGLGSMEIGRILFISHKTVKNHIGSLYSKLNVKTRYALLKEMIRLGYVKLDTLAPVKEIEIVEVKALENT